MKPKIQILPDIEQLVRTAACEFIRLAKEAVEEKGFFTVALSGGSTPKGLYSLLASKADSFRSQVTWNKIHFFWGDERHVPPDHPDSNYRMAHEAMMSKVPVPPENIHRVRAENPDAVKAAEDYEQTLRRFFKLKAERMPRFDLVLLGMGSDGHTASLFPGSDVIHEKERLVAASWVKKFHTYRITFTPPLLNNAACVIFLVAGEEKAEALRAVLHKDYEPEHFPARIIKPTNGKLIWLLDQTAGQLLKPDLIHG